MDWMVFWGNGLIVRQRDHVIFDMLYTSVSPKIRKWLAIISALIIAITLLIVIEPTWSKVLYFKIEKNSNTFKCFWRLDTCKRYLYGFLHIFVLLYQFVIFIEPIMYI